MNVLFYLSLKLIVLYITPLIHCDKTYKVLVCHQNKIKIEHESSNIELTNLKLSSKTISKKSSAYGNQTKRTRNTVYDDPSLSELIQSGIQKTIQVSNYITKKDVYKYFEKNSLFIDIPSENNEFIFRAFAAENFLNLRNLYQIADDFNTSFQNSLLVQTFNLQYKQFYTTNWKFSVEVVEAGQFILATSILAEYFSHFCKNKSTLIPKIAGLYYFKYQNVEYYTIVMTNIFPHILRKPLNQIYYIKGVQEEKSLKTNKNGITMYCHQDKNFLGDYPRALKIPSNIHDEIETVLKNDSTFLDSVEIRDYTLVLIITPSNKPIYKKGSNVISVIKKLSDSTQEHLETIPNQQLGKRRIIVTNGNENLVAYIGIVNLFQTKNASIGVDLKGYGKRFVNCISRNIFQSVKN